MYWVCECSECVSVLGVEIRVKIDYKSLSVFVNLKINFFALKQNSVSTVTLKLHI